MCLQFLKKIVIGLDAQQVQTKSNSYVQQAHFVKQIWNGYTYGLERLFRLFLCLIQFIYPTLLIKNLFRNAIYRKLVIESYIVLKLIFPIMVLALGWHKNLFVLFIVVYFLTETIIHLLSLIFLSDVHSLTVSYTRAILLLFIQYIEVILDFAVIYLRFNFLNKPLSAISSVYFSFVTNTTLGFGEYHPVTSLGQIVVILQLMIFVLFLVLFINYFTTHLKRSE